MILLSLWNSSHRKILYFYFSNFDIFLGLLAKNALDCGLRIPSFTQTYLSPGSGVVTTYLRESGALKPLEKLG
jgi:aconitase A